MFTQSEISFLLVTQCIFNCQNINSVGFLFKTETHSPVSDRFSTTFFLLFLQFEWAVNNKNTKKIRSMIEYESIL